MEKDRHRRYASASELAADIERHLGNEAVAAGPPGAAYRLKKAVRRHRVAVAAAASVVLALLLGLITSTALLVRARQAEATARLEASRNAIEVDAMRALVDGKDAEFVERTWAALALERRGPTGDPKRLALYLTNLVGLIGVLQVVGGESPNWPPAVFMRQIDREAIALLVSAKPEDDPALRQAVDMMRDYAEQRRPESRLALLRKSVELRERMVHPDSSLREAREKLADELTREGDRLVAAGRPAEALPLLEEARDRWKKVNPLSDGYAESQGALGACLLALHRYPEAERSLLEAYRRLNRREQLVQLIDLYRKWGRPGETQRYDQSVFVDRLRDVGPMPPWLPVVSRSKGYSGTRDGRTIWLFQCMYQAGRGLSPQIVKSNTWSWSQNENAAAGIMLNQAQEPTGTPAQLLSLTPEEVARTAADPKTELSIELGPLIPDPTRQRSLVVYSLLTNPKGDWRQKSLGSSIAVWKNGADRPVRPIVRPGVPDPTLLFEETEPKPAGAIAVGDTLYLYATKPDFMSHSATLAKVPLANCLERGAWRYYAGAGRWSERPTDAVKIMQSSPELTVHWNPYLRKYLAVTSRSNSVDIELWTADLPEGPWSFRQAIRPVVEPAGPGQWTREALGHVELARDGGRVEYLTYARPIDAFNREVRLMEIVFR